MDTHTQNTILCQIDVLVIEHLFFRIRVDWPKTTPDQFWQEYTHEDVASCEIAGHHLVRFELLVDRLEVLSQKSIAAVHWPQGFHGVARESTGKHMDKLEYRFERLVNQMGEVVFDLLCFLNVNKVKTKSTEPVEIFFFVHLLILNLLCLQTHIATNASDMRPSPHVVVHLVQSFRVRSQSHVQQDSVFRLQLITNAIEEPVVR